MSDQEDRPSYRAAIEGLEVGQSYSRSQRVDGDRITKDTVGEITTSLRQSLQPAAHRVTKDTGAQFKIESGDFFTRSRDLIVVVVVTRV